MVPSAGLAYATIAYGSLCRIAYGSFLYRVPGLAFVTLPIVLAYARVPYCLRDFVPYCLRVLPMPHCLLLMPLFLLALPIPYCLLVVPMPVCLIAYGSLCRIAYGSFLCLCAELPAGLAYARVPYCLRVLPLHKDLGSLCCIAYGSFLCQCAGSCLCHIAYCPCLLCPCALLPTGLAYARVPNCLWVLPMPVCCIACGSCLCLRILSNKKPSLAKLGSFSPTPQSLNIDSYMVVWVYSIFVIFKATCPV